MKSVGTALEAGNRGSPGLVEVLWHIQGYAEGYDRECKWPSTDRAGTKSRPPLGQGVSLDRPSLRVVPVDL